MRLTNRAKDQAARGSSARSASFNQAAPGFLSLVACFGRQELRREEPPRAGCL